MQSLSVIDLSDEDNLNKDNPVDNNMFPYLKSGLFEALRNQLENHLNINCTGTMLEDKHFTEIQDNKSDYQEYYERNANAFDDYLSSKVYHVNACNVF